MTYDVGRMTYGCMSGEGICLTVDDALCLQVSPLNLTDDIYTRVLLIKAVGQTQIKKNCRSWENLVSPSSFALSLSLTPHECWYDYDTY